jgi:hypothetical protein
LRSCGVPMPSFLHSLQDQSITCKHLMTASGTL